MSMNMCQNHITLGNFVTYNYPRAQPKTYLESIGLEAHPPYFIFNFLTTRVILFFYNFFLLH